jgi:exonuclease 1
MAYMVREGLADFAITEDSDLIAYGCPKTVMKLNYNGYGIIFDIEWFRNEKNLGKDKEGKVLYDE